MFYGCFHFAAVGCCVAACSLQVALRGVLMVTLVVLRFRHFPNLLAIDAVCGPQRSRCKFRIGASRGNTRSVIVFLGYWHAVFFAGDSWPAGFSLLLVKLLVGVLVAAGGSW